MHHPPLRCGAGALHVHGDEPWRPGLFPGTTSLEQLLIQRFGNLFHCPEAGGYATSGGTESNIQALRLAKACGTTSQHPNVIVPDSAHFSFKKACDILGLEMRRVPLTKDYRMDADAGCRTDR